MCWVRGCGYGAFITCCVEQVRLGKLCQLSVSGKCCWQVWFGALCVGNCACVVSVLVSVFSKWCAGKLFVW